MLHIGYCYCYLIYKRLEDFNGVTFEFAFLLPYLYLLILKIAIVICCVYCFDNSLNFYVIIKGVKNFETHT